MSLFGISGNSNMSNQNMLNLIQLSGIKSTAAYQSVSDKLTSQGTASSGNSEASTFLNNYHTRLLELEEAASKLQEGSKDNVFTQGDTDKIVSAVSDLVDSHNSVTSYLEKNQGWGTGTASHMAAFDRGLADEKTLNKLGISYNKSGELVLDKEVLQTALKEDYEGTKALIGGQFGIGEKAASRADMALSTSVQSLMNNSLSTQSQSDNSLSFQQFSNFAKSGPYNLGNYYTVGLLFNTQA